MFIGEILANMTQVSDVAPGPLVYSLDRAWGLPGLLVSMGSVFLAIN
jgi:hypothetical protein